MRTEFKLTILIFESPNFVTKIRNNGEIEKEQKRIVEYCEKSKIFGMKKNEEEIIIRSFNLLLAIYSATLLLCEAILMANPNNHAGNKINILGPNRYTILTVHKK